MKFKIKIEDLGFDEFFEFNRIKLDLNYFQVARVVAAYKESFEVQNTNGKYNAKLTGKFLYKASSGEDYPAVGDWVAISTTEDTKAIIHSVLSRKTLSQQAN